MPSHRADTPADAPTLPNSLPNSLPDSLPPLPRRRDLRARPAATPAGTTTSGATTFGATTFGATTSGATTFGATTSGATTSGATTFGALALAERPGTVAGEPLPAGEPFPEPRSFASLLERGDAPLATVQPLRRPRGGQRARQQGLPAQSRQGLPQGVRRGSRPEPAARPARRPNPVSAPQVGIVGALGIATIAAPLAAHFTATSGAGPAATTTAVVAQRAATTALTPLPPFPLVAAPPLTALADTRLLPDEQAVGDVPAALVPPRVLLVQDGRASRGTARAVLPGCDGSVPDVTAVQNGSLPASMLCTLWDPKRQLRSDSAVALAKLNVAYTKRFGHAMCLNDAYRSLAAQYRMKALRGGYAARPGTSEHGWGLAVDLCDGVELGPGSPTHAWLRANAPAYGWENPTWARSGGGGPYEPWHWEYMPGEQGQGRGD